MVRYTKSRLWCECLLIHYTSFIQIYVEIERARLTKTLANIKEQNGEVKEAASILQELQVRYLCGGNYTNYANEKLLHGRCLRYVVVCLGGNIWLHAEKGEGRVYTGTDEALHCCQRLHSHPDHQQEDKHQILPRGGH